MAGEALADFGTGKNGSRGQGHVSQKSLASFLTGRNQASPPDLGNGRGSTSSPRSPPFLLHAPGLKREPPWTHSRPGHTRWPRATIYRTEASARAWCGSKRGADLAVVPRTGFEPARSIKSTSPSSWRVCQFHHLGRQCPHSSSHWRGGKASEAGRGPQARARLRTEFFPLT